MSQTVHLKKCPQCGLTCSLDTLRCPCGHQFTTQFSQPTQAFQPCQTFQSTGLEGYAIASMVLGIICVLSMCAWMISIPCGLLAVVFGYMSLKSRFRGMAITGLICGIIGLALVTLFILGLASIMAAGSAAHPN